MKLWNIKTGALWEGSPVDARELLARGGGWSKEEPVKPDTIEPEKIEVSGTITSYFDDPELIEKYVEKTEPGPEPEQPREKRKYTRHWEK